MRPCLSWRLELEVCDLDARLLAVATRLARVETELKRLPTKASVLAAALGGMGMAAVVAVGVGTTLA